MGLQHTCLHIGLGCVAYAAQPMHACSCSTMSCGGAQLPAAYMPCVCTCCSCKPPVIVICGTPLVLHVLGAASASHYTALGCTLGYPSGLHALIHPVACPSPCNGVLEQPQVTPGLLLYGSCSPCGVLPADRGRAGLVLVIQGGSANVAAQRMDSAAGTADSPPRSQHCKDICRENVYVAV
jgi:hypothetical protein